MKNKLFIIYLLILLTSCEDPFEDLDFDSPNQNTASNNTTDKPRYHALDSLEKEWLDLDGYWIYQDSLVGRIDTVYGTSELSAWQYANCYEDALGISKCNWGPYFEKLELTFTNSNVFNGDSTMNLYIYAYYNNWGIVVDTRFKDYNLFSRPSMRSTNATAIISEPLEILDYRKFYLSKGVGITRVEYNHNDSINVVNLIDYKLE